MGFVDQDLVVLQPTRAIPRKEVARGIEFTEDLATRVPERNVRFWLTGPAENGFEGELQRLLAAARVPVTIGRADRANDAYAASDVVVFPSSWEGFGNPVIEATIADRPIAAAPYPVLTELRQLGLNVFPVDQPEAVVAWLAHPDRAVIESNRECLRAHFDLADLPERLTAAFATVGWEHW
jgi:glycosyltransferase involved in cell wall biosynthesis